MNFGYMLRCTAITVGVGISTVVGCGGAASSELLDPGGPGGGDGGGGGGNDGNVNGDSGGGGNGDAGQNRDTGTDANEPPPKDAGPPPGVRCDDGESTLTKSCVGGTPVCCIKSPIFGKTYACQSNSSSDCDGSGNVRAVCDNDADCSQGRRCCGHRNGGSSFSSITCDRSDSCDEEQAHACVTDDDCQTGRCSGTDSANKAYHYCE